MQFSYLSRGAKCLNFGLRPIWCSGSGVVLDCINSWSLPSSLLSSKYILCIYKQERIWQVYALTQACLSLHCSTKYHVLVHLFCLLGSRHYN